MKILVFGASGSGTTTLAKELASKTEYTHLDVDDYYWKPTHPPYQDKVPLPERSARLLGDFNTSQDIILSGSLVSWGAHWRGVFDLAVFIYLDPKVRIARLEQRERERYGQRLDTDQKVRTISKAFIEWAKQYDDTKFKGRSLEIHNQWIDTLQCSVIRLDGETDLDVKVNILLDSLEGFQGIK